MARPGNSEHTLFYLFIVLALIVPVSAAESNTTALAGGASPYSILLFIPTESMVHSTQIMDMVNIPDEPGTVLLATSFGLSQYNGTWSTRHINRQNMSEGLLSDFITAIEYDRNGSLWIGYSGGLQIYNGHYYRTIRDQQLFKDPRITAIRRWNDDMWVLTGNAGIHRYRNGEWTWYQPESKGGPGFYEGTGMVLDPATDALLIGSDHEGLWQIPSQRDPIQFECIAPRDGTYGLLNKVRRDSMGGALFFNTTSVAHYTRDSGFTIFVTSDMLTQAKPSINDVAAGPDGRIYLATDQGIFIWKNGKVLDNLDRFTGIGTFPIVEWIYVDAEDRIWFSTNDEVGVITDKAHPLDVLTIGTPTPEVPAATPIPWTYYVTISSPQNEPSSSPQKDSESPLNIISDPIVQVLHAILAGIGFG